MSEPDCEYSEFAEWWFSEASAAGQDQYLFSRSLHNRLSGLWQYCPDRPALLPEEGLPGIHLLDVLTVTRTSQILRGITHDGLPVCVKLPRTQAAPGPEAMEILNATIRSESLALQKLSCKQHPAAGLPTYVAQGEFCVSDDVTLSWIATRYVAGLTPLTLWNHDRGTDEVLELLMRLCRCVQTLHEAGWVHGDLHPGNVLIDSGSQPFLADFGCARMWRGRRWFKSSSPRYFMPPIPIVVHETQHTASHLTPAFDVLCLALIARDLLQERLGKNAVFSASEFSASIQTGAIAQSARLDRLLKACSWYEPERRLQSANELAEAIRGLPAGPLRIRRRSFQTVAIAKMRRYAVFTISAAWLFMVLLLSAAVWFHITLREREQFNELLRLQSLMVSQLASIPDNPAEDSKRAAARLQTMTQLLNLLASQQQPDEQIQSTLEQILSLSRAILDLDGTTMLRDLLSDAVEHARALVDRSAVNPDYQLLLIELLATDAYCQYDRSIDRKPESIELAERSAQDALETFLSIHSKVPRESRSRALRTAFFLADHALLSQISTDWIRQRRLCPFQQVWDQAERLACVVFTTASVAADPDAVYWRSALLTIRALARHKSGFREEFRGSSSRATVLRSLDQAESQIQRLLQETPASLTIPVPIMQSLHGRVLSIWGMVLKNGVNADFIEATEKLTATLNIRQQLFDAAPNSLQRRRGLIATAQNLADCYDALCERAGSPAEREALRRKECDLRRQATDLAAEPLRQNRGRLFQEAYGVNIVRLIAAQLDLGHDADVERLLEEMLQLLEVPGPPYGDGLADPLIPALGARWQRLQTPESHELLHLQITDLMQHLSDVRSNPEVLNFTKSRLMGFLTAPHRSALLSALRTRADWQELELLLADSENRKSSDQKPRP